MHGSNPASDRFAPEHEFLLRATRVDVAESGDLRTLAGAPLDWAWLIFLARVHGLLPLLGRTIHETCEDLTPEEIREQLRDDLRQNARRNLSLASEVIRLSAALQAERITAIAYKSPVLAALAYGDIGLRRFRDLDIVVRPSDVDRSRRVLIASGYTESRCPERTSEVLRLWSGGQLSFWREDEIVELHWQIAPSHTPFDLDGAWGRTGRTQIGHGEVATFALEDLLLILCVHGASHAWERLAWIRDVAGLVSRHEIDWTALFDRASSAGVRRILATGLLLSADFFGSPVPPEVADSCRADAGACALAVRSRQKLLDRLPGSRGGWEHAAFHLRARERVVDRLRYGFRFMTAPTPAEWEMLRLPSLLNRLYPLLRPVRLGLRELKRCAGH